MRSWRTWKRGPSTGAIPLVTPDPPFWEGFYASFWQHPVLLWVAIALSFGMLRAFRLPLRTRRYCMALVAVSVLDAWLTTTEVPGLGRLTGAWASLVPLFFVLVGDLRYLLLVTSAEPNGDLAPSLRKFWVALALMCVVPLFSQGLLAILPTDSGPRLLFLIYELAFVLLTIHLLVFHPNLARVSWMRSVSRFVLLYYGLWALADVLILTLGVDWGFGLRVLPNLLYYAGLIAVIAAAASRAHRQAEA